MYGFFLGECEKKIVIFIYMVLLVIKNGSFCFVIFIKGKFIVMWVRIIDYNIFFEFFFKKMCRL